MVEAYKTSSHTQLPSRESVHPTEGCLLCLPVAVIQGFLHTKPEPLPALVAVLKGLLIASVLT